MSTRTVVVTGATAGIGYYTALGLAARGARTVLLARDGAKARRARRKIQRATGNEGVRTVIADFSRLSEVRRAAQEITERFGVLHVLVNNAAVVARERTVTEDGHELQFAVNHLAPFLLTHSLLPVLKASAPARIVTVSSQVHSEATFDFDDLAFERNYVPLEAYYRSKLANILMTYALCRRLRGTRVTANCLHPGVYATTLLLDYLAVPRWRAPLLKLQHHGPHHGAKTSLYLASSPQVENDSGRYYRNDTGEARSSPASYDEGLQERLWKISALACGISIRNPTCADIGLLQPTTSGRAVAY